MKIIDDSICNTISVIMEPRKNFGRHELNNLLQSNVNKLPLVMCDLPQIRRT